MPPETVAAFHANPPPSRLNVMYYKPYRFQADKYVYIYTHRASGRRRRNPLRVGGYTKSLRTIGIHYNVGTTSLPPYGFVVWCIQYVFMIIRCLMTRAPALFRGKGSSNTVFFFFFPIIFPVHLVQFFPLCVASRTTEREISFTVLLSVSILRLHVRIALCTRTRKCVYQIMTKERTVHLVKIDVYLPPFRARARQRPLFIRISCACSGMYRRRGVYS
jgi:hypothetical protein